MNETGGTQWPNISRKYTKAVQALQAIEMETREGSSASLSAADGGQWTRQEINEFARIILRELGEM